MALNKLKKWIGTQAMTAFFDQLNDNVDATNAAIDLAESLNNNIKNNINMDAGVLNSGGAIFNVEPDTAYLFTTAHGNIQLSATLIVYKGIGSAGINVHAIHQGANVSYEAIDLSRLKITSPANTSYALIKLTDNPSV